MPSFPPITGLDPKTALTAIDVLNGKVIIPGGKVLIVGGSAVGCEVADMLVEKARGPLHVNIVEMAEEVMSVISSYNRIPLMNRLIENNVKIDTSTKVIKINEDNSVKVELPSGEMAEFGPYTHIIFCSGTKPNENVAEDIAVTEIYKIGDLTGPGLVMHAVKAGADIGRLI